MGWLLTFTIGLGFPLMFWFGCRIGRLQAMDEFRKAFARQGIELPTDEELWAHFTGSKE